MTSIVLREWAAGLLRYFAVYAYVVSLAAMGLAVFLIVLGERRYAVRLAWVAVLCGVIVRVSHSDHADDRPTVQVIRRPSIGIEPPLVPPSKPNVD